MNSHLPIKILLWIIAVYHVASGILIIASGDLALWFARAYYGWTIDGSTELGILAQLLGCYAIAFGLMLATAARDPVRYRSFLTVGVVLIALRVFQRAYFAGKIIDTFQVSAGRHWLATGFILLLGALLAAFRYQIHRQSSENVAPEAR